MQGSTRPEVSRIGEVKPPLAGTFKTSLRRWQAQWRAQKAAQAGAPAEAAKFLMRPGQA